MKRQINRAVKVAKEYQSYFNAKEMEQRSILQMNGLNYCTKDSICVYADNSNGGIHFVFYSGEDVEVRITNYGGEKSQITLNTSLTAKRLDEMLDDAEKNLEKMVLDYEK